MTDKVIGICADDYGLSPGVSRCLADLAARGRINALSCLTNTMHWREAAAALAGLPPTVQCGLHFNLSEGAPVSAELARVWRRLPPLRELLLRALLGRIPARAVAAELDAQWQRFTVATGRAPDFIDGHQHVHALAGVRDAVLERALEAGVPVRNTGRVEGPGFDLKREVIMACGGRRLAQALAEHAIPTNAVLLGVYDFRSADYRRLLRRWLAAAPAEGALLMCHPGRGADDAIAAARAREAAYFGGEDFSFDLARAHCRLGLPWVRSSSAG